VAGLDPRRIEGTSLEGGQQCDLAAQVAAGEEELKAGDAVAFQADAVTIGAPWCRRAAALKVGGRIGKLGVGGGLDVLGEQLGT
jgi:hypothetical protein